MGANFLTTIIPQATQAIEWAEIIYIVVGAAIGFLLSILTVVIGKLLDKRGKLNIFYCRTNQRGTNGLGWGFDDCVDGRKSFTVAVLFELQNTSNTTRVIRDVSLLLYSGKELVGKMYQFGTLHITNRSGNNVTGVKDYHFGSDKGSYSFVLPPRSIQRQECEYVFTIYPNEQEERFFDRVIVRYFDEKNKAHTFDMMEIQNCWAKKHYDMDEEWILLKKKAKVKADKR